MSDPSQRQATGQATRLDAIPTRRWHLLAAAAVAVLVGTQLLTAWEGADRGWLGYL